MQAEFGTFLRARREALVSKDKSLTVRGLARKIGVQPCYISQVERGKSAPPSEARIIAIAKVLGEDPDVLLAIAGRVSSELQEVIRKRPKVFSELIRQLKDAPDHALLRVVREVRDGNW